MTSGHSRLDRGADVTVSTLGGPASQPGPMTTDRFNVTLRRLMRIAGGNTRHSFNTRYGRLIARCSCQPSDHVETVIITE